MPVLAFVSPALLAVAGGVQGWLIADVTPGESFNPLSLVQYGVLGIVILALMFGFLWTKPAVERLIADKERAEKQRDDLMATIQDKVMPAITSNAEASKRIVSVMEEVTRALDRAYESEDRRPPRRAES